MTVFANNMEVSAKAQGCKVIAAFPDTCFTPPESPATPPGVPIPYPNFAMDSDLKSGSSKVLIKGKEVSQENASKFSKVSGDEAGAAAKKGLITSKNTGKAYAQKWSMDVKIEGKGVVRFADMATTNHMSNTGNDAPWIIAGTPGPPILYKTATCLVGSYDETKDDCAERGGQAHHIIPDQYLRSTTRAVATTAGAAAAATGAADTSRIDITSTSKPDDKSVFPSIGEGCCVCVGGNAYGSAAAESNPQSAQGKLNKAAIVQKGADHAAISGATSLAKTRGHGFLHQFDERFRDLSPPSTKNALDTANDLLDECAAYDQSALDSKCAKKAKQCISKQFSSANKKNANLKSVTPRTAESRAKRVVRLARTPPS